MGNKTPYSLHSKYTYTARSTTDAGYTRDLEIAFRPLSQLSAYHANSQNYSLRSIRWLIPIKFPPRKTNCKNR